MDVEFIKLYTATPSHSTRLDRHLEFMAACRAEGVQVHDGGFKYNNISCRICGTSWRKPEEKESDVHLAVDIVADALQGKIDVAFVLTCDSDIAPAFRLCRELTAVQLVTVAFEPRQHSFELLQECDYKIYVQREHIRRSLLPKNVLAADGTVLATRPSKYNPPKS